jgi:muramidase (phage lysozyme)
MARISAQQAGGKNVLAFLDMLAASEIGHALLALSDDGYNVLVGSTPSHPKLFTSYADHPNILDPATNSTAAGRYQLLHRYYPSYRALLKLSNFSPEAQDLIAIQQIRECRALELVVAGNMAEAVKRVSRIWASMPGAGYGQHENKLAMLQEAYKAAGGIAVA